VKQLVFSIPYGLAFRAVVATGVLHRCVSRGHEAHLLLPDCAPEDRKRLESQIPAGATVSRLRPVPRTPRITTLKFLKQHLYGRRSGSRTFAIKRLERRRRRPLFHAAASMAERVGEICLSEEQVDRWLAASPQPFEDDYARELSGAAALVITKPGYHPDELPVIRAAKRSSVPVVSIDTTWDNFVSKRPAYLPPDVVTVWNAQMQREAIDLYGLAPDAVPSTGGPQFDVFFEPSRLADRASFLSGLGLDPSRPLVVLALNNPSLTPANKAFAAQVAEMAASLRPVAANLVVRLHPWDRYSDYSDLTRGAPGIVVEQAFGRPTPSSVFECLPTANDILHYGALVSYADVLVNIASTVTLDAIAADRPVITLAYDPVPVPSEESTARFCEFTHFKSLIDTGAVSVARSAAELRRLIEISLADPAAAAVARRRARDQFLTFADSRSSDRVASAIDAAVARDRRST
jgi:hypothetical protein